MEMNKEWRSPIIDKLSLALVQLQGAFSITCAMSSPGAKPRHSAKPGTNCWPEPEVSKNINREELGKLGPTEDEEMAVVAFLKTLSDGWSPQTAGVKGGR